MYAHITASGPTQILTGHIRKVRVQVNAALTGSLTLSDETATASTPVVAIVTNPTVGSTYEYWNMKNGITVTPSNACDITISATSGTGANQ